MSDLQKLQPVANRVIRQGVDAGLASLPDEDRVFFLLWSFGGVFVYRVRLPLNRCRAAGASG